MKSPLFRRTLLAAAVALSPAACGDRPTPTPELASDRATPPAPTPAPAPVPSEKPTEVKELMPVPTDYADAMTLGAQARDAGKLTVARAMFDAATRFDAVQHEPHLELARLLLSTNEHKAALASARKATKLAPKSSAAWNTLGRAQLARFAYDDAITAFEQAVELNPKNAFAWNNLGLTLLQLELFSEAQSALETAVALPDATGYMWNNLGIAYEHQDALDDARTAYEAGAAKGSTAAAASRERLEGVKSIVLGNACGVAARSGEAGPCSATVAVIVHDDVQVTVDDEPAVDETEIVEDVIARERADAEALEAEAEAEAEQDL